jgi:hypothetical protein
MRNKIIISLIFIFIVVHITTAQNTIKRKLLVELKIQGVDYPILLSDLKLTLRFRDKNYYTYAQVKQKLGADSLNMGKDWGVDCIIPVYTNDTIIEGKNYVEFIYYIGEPIIEPELILNSDDINSWFYSHNGNLSVDTIFSGNIRAELSMAKEINNKGKVRMQLSFFEQDNLVGYYVYAVPEKLIPKKIRKVLLEMKDIIYFKID